MKKFDKKMFELAKDENVKVPENLNERIANIIENLPEKQVERRTKIKFKTAIVVTAAIITLMSVTAGATIDKFSKRMNDMSDKEKEKMVSDEYKSNAECNSYTRDLSETEKARIVELRKAYENEGVFPKDSVQVIDNIDEAKKGKISFVTKTRTFVVPDGEMTDEELLEIVDYEYKSNYSLIQKNRNQENITENGEYGKSVADDKVSSDETISNAKKVLNNIFDYDTQKWKATVETLDNDEYDVTLSDKKNNRFVVSINAKTTEWTCITDINEEENSDSIKINKEKYGEQYSEIEKIVKDKMDLWESVNKITCVYGITKDNTLNHGNVKYEIELQNSKTYTIIINENSEKIIEISKHDTEEYIKNMNSNSKRSKEILGVETKKIIMYEK